MRLLLVGIQARSEKYIQISSLKKNENSAVKPERLQSLEWLHLWVLLPLVGVYSCEVTASTEFGISEECILPYAEICPAVLSKWTIHTLDIDVWPEAALLHFQIHICL